jgi:hypothetical protein
MADENKELHSLQENFAFERVGCQIAIADRVTYRAAILELLQGNSAAMFRTCPDPCETMPIDNAMEQVR